MRRSVLAVLVVLGVGGFLLCSMPWVATADDDNDEKERAVSLDKVPAKVKATILKAAGKNKVEEIEEVTLTLYEAEWVVDGKEVEVTVTAGGKLLMKEMEEADDDDDDDAEERKEKKQRAAKKDKGKRQADDEDEDEEENEKEVTLGQIPAAAKAAILKLAGKNKITEVEQVRMKFYEAEWEQGKREIEILVTAGGKLISREAERDDDDGDDDEDDDDEDDDDEDDDDEDDD